MLNATNVTTERELAEILTRCGFDSDTPDFAPWTWEWRGKEVPISRYLRGFPYDDFVVAVRDGAFQVYEMDKQNHWFYVVCERRGDISEKELAKAIRTATAPKANSLTTLLRRWFSLSK